MRTASSDPARVREGALALVSKRHESEATRKRSYNEIPDSSQISDNFCSLQRQEIVSKVA